jgi:PTH1 family peptidyl-tRNA hydrolase
MKLVVGLGNLGPEYAQSRHNAGFLSLSDWSAKSRISFKHSILYDFAKCKDAYLIRPNTFMNRSGYALEAAMTKWKIDDVMVIYDDLELPLASIRLRFGGGDGGHNGMKSLSDFYPAADLKRIRIGIGRDDSDPKDYVLDDFTREELVLLKPVWNKVSELIDIYIKDDFNSVLNAFSKWKKSCSGISVPGNNRPKEKDND